MLDLVVMTTLMLPCPELTVTAADEAELADLVADATSEELSGEAFETVSVSKCATDTPATQYGVTTVRTVTTTFEGYFVDRDDDPAVSAQDFVKCTVRRSYFDGEYRNLDKRCQMGTRTLIEFPGVNGAIELGEGMSVERAREVLTILSGYIGQPIAGRSFSAEQFSELTNLSVLFSSTRTIYHAYHETGCLSRSIEMWIHPERSTEVLKLDRSGAIC